MARNLPCAKALRSNHSEWLNPESCMTGVTQRHARSAAALPFSLPISANVKLVSPDDLEAAGRSARALARGVKRRLSKSTRGGGSLHLAVSPGDGWNWVDETFLGCKHLTRRQKFRPRFGKRRA